jgi:hypothetical protein
VEDGKRTEIFRERNALDHQVNNFYFYHAEVALCFVNFLGRGSTLTAKTLHTINLTSPETTCFACP